MRNPARRLDKVDRVVIVLVNAGGDGKHIGIENNVFGRKTYLVDQQSIRELANRFTALKTIGLAFLVKRHNHHGSTVFAAQAGLLQKGLNPFFHGDRIDYRLALHAAQAGFDNGPFGAVDHDRHPGNIGLGGNHVQKAMHARNRIQHGLVHIDVDNLRPALHLLTRHGQGLVVFFFTDQAQKHLAARHVGAFTDVDKQRVLIDIKGLQARKTGFDRNYRNLPHGQLRHFFCNRFDMRRRRTTAASGDIHHAGLRKLLQQARGVGRRFVKTGIGHGVGQASIGIHTNIGIANFGQFGNVGAHQRRTQSAIQANSDRACMTHRIPESLDRLAR